MKKQLRTIDFLGKEVTVIVDRPVNSFHPKYSFRYEINYGYIPNTLAGDNMEVDAYILGADVPLKTFKGIVKAIIFRKNDIEDKLVVTDSEYTLTIDDVFQKTLFQERFFQIEIKLLPE